MNAKIILPLLASLILSACSFGPQSQSTATPTTNEETVEQVETASKEITNAFSSGQPLKCDITSSTAGEPPSTYYIKNSKMRMETVTTGENAGQYFSINDGATVYIWSSNPSVPAMKIPLEQVRKNAASFDNDLQSFPDLSDDTERQKIEDSGSTITCNPGNIDDALFVPPTDITFKSFEEMMGGSLER